jgi:hypothetical protein
MRTLLTLIPSLILLCSGCAEEPTDSFPHEPKLVAWGFFHPAQVFSVKIAKSVPIEDTNIIESTGIQDALVLLYEDGQLIDTLKHEQKGKYSSPRQLKPKAGHVYFITAHKVGYPSIETLPDTMPALLRLQSIKAGWTKTQNSNNQEYYVGLLEAAFEGYPKINDLGLKCEDIDKGGNWQIKTEATCMDEIFSIQGLLYHNFSCFPGLHKIQLYGNQRIYSTTYPKNRQVNLRFSFSVPSRNLTTYFQKFIEHDRSVSDLSSVDIFAQPIFLPDMVKNGYGFVGCFNSQSQILKVE